jgi:hypothetical protein
MRTSGFTFSPEPRGRRYEQLWEHVSRHAARLIVALPRLKRRNERDGAGSSLQPADVARRVAVLLGASWREAIIDSPRLPPRYVELPIDRDLQARVLATTRSFADWARADAPVHELAAVRADGTVVLYLWAHADPFRPGVRAGLCLSPEELGDLRARAPKLADTLVAAELFGDIAPYASAPWLVQA